MNNPEDIAKIYEKLNHLTNSDDGNAEAFLLLFRKTFLYTSSTGWLAYNGTHWTKECAEALLGQKVMFMLKERVKAALEIGENGTHIVRFCAPNANRKNSCINVLQDKLTVSYTEFDNDVNLLNCQNGVVNLRTGQIQEHNPKQLFTYCLPVNYTPAADTSLWLKFLNDVVDGGEEMINYLQLAVGYSLTGLTTEECLFYLFGPTRSGKGTFTECISEIMGKPLADEMSADTISAKKFDTKDPQFELASFKATRFAVINETDRYKRLNEGKIKNITGGGLINTSFKGKDTFTYRPTFKIWITSNWPVNADADDSALWNRVRVIQFPNSFEGKEDKSLKRTLKESSNLEAVLSWAVTGAIKWYQLGNAGLATPKTVAVATKQQRQENDFIQSWLDECTEESADNFVPNIAVKDSYDVWCKNNGVSALGLKELNKTLNTKGFDTGVLSRAKGSDKPQRGTKGFRLLPSGKVGLTGLFDSSDSGKVVSINKNVGS